MNITILQGAFYPIPPVLGGAVEKRWFAMGKEFARQGHCITHISRTFEGFAAEEEIEGVFHIRVKGYSLPASRFYLKWLDLKYSFRAKDKVPIETDVLITNSFWAPLLLPQSLKQRCMVDVARMPKGQMKIYNQVARLRANSSPVAFSIKKEILEKKQGRVCLIPNPLPFDISSDKIPSLKKPIILYVGRLHPEKGLHLLIKACRNLEPGWQVKIVGPWEVQSGGGGEKYLRVLQKLSKDSHIEFVGPVFNMEELNRIYGSASIFVYPSIAEKGETFGLAPLEAMASGCVPIVSNLSCFKDFITHRENGMVFDHRGEKPEILLQDAIKELQFNPQLLGQLAKQALKVQESHSVSTIASQFLKEFDTMVEG